MIDVCLLGTGGMMPLPYRYLTSLMVRYKGKSILVDCGEGTQVALRKKGWSPNPIEMILFTHYHADHIIGGKVLDRRRRIIGGMMDEIREKSLQFCERARAKGYLILWDPAMTVSVRGRRSTE